MDSHSDGVEGQKESLSEVIQNPKVDTKLAGEWRKSTGFGAIWMKVA